MSLKLPMFLKFVSIQGWFFLLLVATLIFGCTSNPPKDMDDICEIFEQNRSWYKASVKSKRKWGAPVHVPMAIMYQESSFKANAKPPRKKILGVIPGRRPSSAKGYAQAQSPAWREYGKSSGNRFADRNDFADSVDFIQWYMDRSQKLNGISKWNAKQQYLNYHEGWTGYRKKTYRSKGWLVKGADNVEARSNKYAQQLKECERNLNKGCCLLYTSPSPRDS